MPVDEQTKKAIEEAFVFDPTLGLKVLAARSATTGDGWWVPVGKGKEVMKNTEVALSLAAVFFNIILYFYRGMWKKGLLVLLGSTVLTVTLAMLGASHTVLNCASWGWAIYLGFAYYRDCYRKYVKKEDFWI